MATNKANQRKWLALFGNKMMKGKLSPDQEDKYFERYNLFFRINNYKTKKRNEIRQRIAERKTRIHKQIENTWSYGKGARFIASIILPLIIFIGIGIRIGTFSGKIIIENGEEIEEQYIKTPYDKLEGITKLIASVGEDYQKALQTTLYANREAVEKGDLIEQMKNDETTDIFGNKVGANSWLGESIGNQEYNNPIETMVTTQSTNNMKFRTALGMCWFLIKEPFVLTFRIVDYLVND